MRLDAPNIVLPPQGRQSIIGVCCCSGLVHTIVYSFFLYVAVRVMHGGFVCFIRWLCLIADSSENLVYKRVGYPSVGLCTYHCSVDSSSSLIVFY